MENVLALFDETIDDSKAQLIADTYNIPLEKVNAVRAGEQATSIPQLARYMSLMGYNVCITLEKDD